ncbi:MAG: heavy metal-binding domain-containing protein [Acidimicrobiales bacterium]
MVRPWSSGLPVGEVGQMLDAGLSPVGQVLGTSVYGLRWTGYCGGGYGGMSGGFAGGGFGLGGVGAAGYGGYGSAGFGATYRMAPYEEALADARALALGRMRAEAKALGATVVAGTQVTMTEVDAQYGLFEFKALGTALAGGRRAPDEPVLSNLSGHDLAVLLAAGWMPTGIAAGISALHVHTGYRSSQQMSGWNMSNTEVTQYSEAMHEARSLAMGSVRSEMRRLKGVGVVAETITYRSGPSPCTMSEVEDRFVEFIALGTVITPWHTSMQLPPPMITKSLA